MTAIKDLSLRFKKIGDLIAFMIIFSLFKLKVTRVPKRNQANVYAEETRIVENDQGMNIPILHKPLIKGDYLFESVHRGDVFIEFCLLEFKVMIFNIGNSIFMVNFGEASAKIYKGQFLKRMIRLQTTPHVATVNLNLADVFFGKVPSENPVNFFAIDSFESDDVVDSDVNNH